MARRPSLLTIAAVASPFVIPTVAGGTILSNAMDQDWEGVADAAKERFLGLGTDGKFHIDYVVKTYTPLVIAMILSKILSKLGLNRRIPKWVPFTF